MFKKGKSRTFIFTNRKVGASEHVTCHLIRSCDVHLSDDQQICTNLCVYGTLCESKWGGGGFSWLKFTILSFWQFDSWKQKGGVLLFMLFHHHLPYLLPHPWCTCDRRNNLKGKGIYIKKRFPGSMCLGQSAIQAS